MSSHLQQAALRRSRSVKLEREGEKDETEKQSFWEANGFLHKNLVPSSQRMQSVQGSVYFVNIRGIQDHEMILKSVGLTQHNTLCMML